MSALATFAGGYVPPVVEIAHRMVTPPAPVCGDAPEVCAAMLLALVVMALGGDDEARPGHIPTPMPPLAPPVAPPVDPTTPVIPPAPVPATGALATLAGGLAALIGWRRATRRPRYGVDTPTAEELADMRRKGENA